MNETTALIQKAQRYIRSAKLLIKDGDNESAVSRLYYAMFYCAEAALLTKDLSYSSHKGVLSGFGEHFIKTGIFERQMGRNLNLAFEKRQLDDYEYTFVFESEEVRQLLKNAQAFTDAVSDWLNTK
jgi:uncharacterized protein (UPF0332 family)